MIKKLLLKKSQGLPVVEKPKGLKSFLNCRVENEGFLVNLKSVKELVELEDIVPIPGAGDGILGALNLRNEVVIIVDVRGKFQINEVRKTPLTRIIIVEIFLENESELFGILIDEVKNIIQVSKEQFAEKVENGNELYESYINLDGQVCGVLDLKKVFFDYKV